MKSVFCIIGSHAVGKTTQMRKIIEAITDSPPTWCGGKEGDLNYFMTQYDSFAVLGKIGLNQCTGIDSVYGSLGVEGVTKSLEVALRDNDLIFMDCVFFSVKWIEDWKKKEIRNKFNLFIIHLTTDNYTNLRRLSERKAKKEKREDWWNIHLTDTTYKHILGKNREFISIYSRVKSNNLAQGYIEIDASKDVESISSEILNFLSEKI